MAGLRVGYAVAHESIAHEIAKVRGPYRLDHLAETAASLALADDRYVDETVAAVRAERPNVKRALEERGFTVYRSDANFFLTKPPVDANALAAALAQHGVVTRDFGGELKEYLRITIGPPQATARLRLALDDVLPKLRGGGA
jgi:histidinol-phosphate aminotransferase